MSAGIARLLSAGLCAFRTVALVAPLALGCAVLSSSWVPAVAQAQEEPLAATDDSAAEDAASARSESFRAVEGGVQEDIAGGPLMLAVYVITWLGVFLYVVRLVLLQQRTLADVQRLSSQLQQAEGGRGES